MFIFPNFLYACNFPCIRIKNSKISSNEKKHFLVSKDIRNVKKSGKVFLNRVIIVPIYFDKNSEVLAALLGVVRDLNCKDILSGNINHIPLNCGIIGIQACNIDLNLVLTNPQAPYKVIWVNKQWCDLCEFQSEEIIGKSLNILQQWSIFDSFNRSKNIAISKDMMLELEEKLKM